MVEGCRKLNKLKIACLNGNPTRSPTSDCRSALGGRKLLFKQVNNCLLDQKPKQKHYAWMCSLSSPLTWQDPEFRSEWIHLSTSQGSPCESHSELLWGITPPCPPVNRGSMSRGRAEGWKGSSQLLSTYIFCLNLTKSHEVAFITLISHMNDWGLREFKKLDHGLSVYWGVKICSQLYQAPNSGLPWNTNPSSSL